MAKNALTTQPNAPFPHGDHYPSLCKDTMAGALQSPGTTQPDTATHRHWGKRGDLHIPITMPQQKPPATAIPTTDTKHITGSPQDRGTGPLRTQTSSRLREGGAPRGGTPTGYCTGHRRCN
ncbi:Hypothetical predicted protein [Pelobates cultripes]|uniref:Uncharacterized protein n=1 Tax=Pelobates cultripes TaxID=61616 RepID=A0AAD1WZU0_PELCU|nr:Hypothetical predicted protein [Pelobates cultripes]